VEKMKIPVHYSLKVARKVVAKIDLPAKVAKDCTVESWSNGREQGLCIKRFAIPSTMSKQIVIAQQRSSDNILIVSGSQSDFDFQTNHPSDDVWVREGARTHFLSNEVLKAARYIETLLGIEKVEQKVKEPKKTVVAMDTKEDTVDDKNFQKSYLAELLT
jgi:hypothetical protein